MSKLDEIVARKVREELCAKCDRARECKVPCEYFSIVFEAIKETALEFLPPPVAEKLAKEGAP